MIDEFGRVAGLITIEDVLEQIVGEIEDEFDIDDDEGDVFSLPDGSFRVNGDATLERVSSAFAVNLLAREDPPDFDTIGGLVAHEMGQKVGCGGHLLTLRRLASGKFDVADAHTLEAILGWSDAELEKNVIPYLKLKNYE